MHRQPFLDRPQPTLWQRLVASVFPHALECPECLSPYEVTDPFAGTARACARCQMERLDAES